MSKNEFANISVRSAASYRKEARTALKGKWKPALLVALLLALISGALFGVSVNFTTDDSAPGYGILTAAIGPVFSQTYWTTEGMAIDAADRVQQPGLIPMNEQFILSAALLTFVLLLLSPVYSLSTARLTKRLLENGEISLSLISFSGYWRMAKTLLLLAVRVIWLPALMLFGGAALAILVPAEPIVIPVIALTVFAVILLIRNSYSYSPMPMLSVLRPDLTVREIANESKRMMKGHRVRLFGLTFSFIGWSFLAGLVASLLTGIASVIPSMPMAVLFALTVLANAAVVPVTLYLQTATFAFVRDRTGLGAQPDEIEQACTAPTAAPINPAEDDTWTDSSYQPFASAGSRSSSDDKPSDQ